MCLGYFAVEGVTNNGVKMDKDEKI